jgi:beta-phosphoglucomutase-like phosphatase (HAD superfamily)
MSEAGPRGRLLAAIFDVDGVLVASPHERAWRESLAGYADPARFTTEFYQAQLPASPGWMMHARRWGVWCSDAPHTRRVCRKKQAPIDRLTPGAARGISGRGAVRECLVRGRLAAGTGLFVEERRSHAAPSERADGRPLLSIFDADLSGTDVPRGKPDPALFLLAAQTLKVPPAHCVVVEDAPAGIAAARAGGMASVGIARLGDQALLQGAQADLVVTSLGQVDATAVLDGILRARPPTEMPAHA